MNISEKLEDLSYSKTTEIRVKAQQLLSDYFDESEPNQYNMTNENADPNELFMD
jgi:hypothetical protein